MTRQYPLIRLKKPESGEYKTTNQGEKEDICSDFKKATKKSSWRVTYR